MTAGAVGRYAHPLFLIRANSGHRRASRYQTFERACIATETKIDLRGDSYPRCWAISRSANYLGIGASDASS